MTQFATTAKSMQADIVICCLETLSSYSASIAAFDLTNPISNLLFANGTVTESEFDVCPVRQHEPPPQFSVNQPSVNGTVYQYLSWMSPLRGTYTGFLVEYKRVDDTKWKSEYVASHQGHWHFLSLFCLPLKKGVEYVFRVSAVDKKGKGALSKEVKAVYLPGEVY